MSHPLQCRCGTIQGHVDDPRSANRALCYCRDCQAFAHFLGSPRATLKARLNGDYKRTPFFRGDTGAPIVSARVLSGEEHAKLMDSVRAF
jgi:hypothetical protein